MALGQAFGLTGQVSVLTARATTDTQPVTMPESQLNLTTTKEKIQKWILQKKLERDVKVRFNERGLVISLMTDKVLFDSGQADFAAADKGNIVGYSRIVEGTDESDNRRGTHG